MTTTIQYTPLEALKKYLPWTIEITKVSSDGKKIVFKIREKYLLVELEKHYTQYPVHELVKKLMIHLSKTPIVYVPKEELIELLQAQPPQGGKEKQL